MSHVTVTVAGERYTVACVPGDGPKIEALAGELDKAVGTLRRRVGDIGETRLAVFAALSLLDRLEALRHENAELSERVATLERAREQDALAGEADEDAFVARIEHLSETVERIAALINDDTRTRTEALHPQEVSPKPDEPPDVPPTESDNPTQDTDDTARLDISPGAPQ